MERLHRQGCEFSRSVKELARSRSQGFCEYPGGCEMPHDNTVDHLTGCFLGQLLGMERWVLRSLENAQMLCTYHNETKTREEYEHIKRLAFQLGARSLEWRDLNRLQLGRVYTNVS